MPSIRRSLLGYLLVLLALALGAVGLLVDRFANAAMRAREEAETKRIEHQYVSQERKATDQFEAGALSDAKRLSSDLQGKLRTYLALQRPRGSADPMQPAPGPGAVTTPILAPDEEVREFRTRSEVLQLGVVLSLLTRSSYHQTFTLWPTDEVPNRSNQSWRAYDAPRLFARLQETLREDYKNDEHFGCCQFAVVAASPNNARRIVGLVRAGHGGPDMPFNVDAVEQTPNFEVRDIKAQIPGSGECREVVLAVTPRFFPVPVTWYPPDSTIMRTARPGGGRSDLWIHAYVQVVRPYSVLHARLAEDRKARDEQIASVRQETRDEIARLRSRLGLISGGTFVALVIGGWWIVARGLFPMRKLSDAVSKVSEKDFRLPIEPAELGRELAPIHARLTQTFDLLRGAFAREKQAVADISHELRTPIASLLATLDVALRKPRTVDQYRTTLEDCRVICKQLGQLVERIMTLASLDAGTARTVHVRTDAADLAAGCAAVIRPLATANGQTLESHVAAPLELDTDPDKLREVLVNLLHNAVEYNRPGGRIELAGRRENGSVVLEVRDTGIGMTPDVKDKIFERFYRADASRQATGVHAGLGLAIVREYIDRLGGTITVASTAGVGSTFRVELPAPADTPAEPAAALHSATRTTGEPMAARS